MILLSGGCEFDSWFWLLLGGNEDWIELSDRCLYKGIAVAVLDICCCCCNWCINNAVIAGSPVIDASFFNWANISLCVIPNLPAASAIAAFRSRVGSICGFAVKNGWLISGRVWGFWCTFVAVPPTPVEVWLELCCTAAADIIALRAAAFAAVVFGDDCCWWWWILEEGGEVSNGLWNPFRSRIDPWYEDDFEIPCWLKREAAGDPDRACGCGGCGGLCCWCWRCASELASRTWGETLPQDEFWKNNESFND